MMFLATFLVIETPTASQNVFILQTKLNSTNCTSLERVTEPPSILLAHHPYIPSPVPFLFKPSIRRLSLSRK